MDTHEIERALEECEFFSGIVEKDLRTVAGLCEIKTFGVGELVFRQGDFGEHLYVLTGGQVNLERSVELAGRKGNVMVSTLGKGRMLGCWSTLLGEPHVLMCSAVCEKPTTVLTLSGARLRELMNADSDLGYAVLERLCFLLRDRVQSAYGAFERI